MAEPAPHGSREAVREFIAGIALGTGNHAAVVATYAEIGNDAGLLYAARCLRAYVAALDAGNTAHVLYERGRPSSGLA